MRKLSVVLVAAMLLATGNVLANDKEIAKPNESLSSQIATMLKKNNFSEEDCNHIAQVRFTLNTKGEIVVLSVTTDFEALEKFVKSSLNYKKVDLIKVEEGKIYTLPVRLKA